MAWIESHDTLGEHPKTKRLARTLGVSTVQAVGHLQFFWWWAMNYADDGNITEFEPIDIAEGAKWEGDHAEFFNALITSKFVEIINEETVIHDWHVYGGKLVQRKNSNAERMRNTRAKHMQNACETCVEPEKSTGEKSTEQDSTLPSVEFARTTKKGRPNSARIPLPDDWIPPLDEQTASEQFNLPVKTVRLETDQFRDHHRKVGSVFADWNAAWRNWMRRVPDFARSNPNGYRPPGKRFPTELTIEDLVQRARGNQ